MWDVDSSGTKESCIGCGPDPPKGKGIFCRGHLLAHCKVWCEPKLLGGSSDASFCCQYCSSLVKYSVEKLTVLLLLQLVVTPSLISTSIFVTVIHMLVMMCMGCPDLAVVLLKLSELSLVLYYRNTKISRLVMQVFPLHTDVTI